MIALTSGIVGGVNDGACSSVVVLEPASTASVGLTQQLFTVARTLWLDEENDKRSHWKAAKSVF